MKPDGGRLALSGLNVALALALGLLVWRTFFFASQPAAAELVDRIKPQDFAVSVSVKTNKADELKSAWAVDRPKPVAAPVAVEKPPEPPKPEELSNIFQVLAVAQDPKNPKNSSVILKRKGGNPSNPGAIDDQIQFGVGDKLESYELKAIVENKDGSVDITILDGQRRDCKIKFTPERQ